MDNQENILGNELENILGNDEDVVLDNLETDVELTESEEKNAEIEENYLENSENIFNNVKCDKKTGVYVKVNNMGFVTDVNSDIFIENFDGWIKIDEGEGEKYTHAQTAYFGNSIIDEFGNFRYKI